MTPELIAALANVRFKQEEKAMNPQQFVELIDLVFRRLGELFRPTPLLTSIVIDWLNRLINFLEGDAIGFLEEVVSDLRATRDALRGMLNDA